MVSVVLQADDGRRVELEISERDHIHWQIGHGEAGVDERGYCAWNELEGDLAEGICGVKRQLVEAVQVWMDNYMITDPAAVQAFQERTMARRGMERAAGF